MTKKPTDAKTKKLLAKLRFPMTEKARKELGRHVVTLEPLLTDAERTAAKNAVSNLMPAGALTNRDLLTDYKWKRGQEEKPEAIKAAQDKAKRIGLSGNKQGYEYFGSFIQDHIGNAKRR